VAEPSVVVTSIVISSEAVALREKLIARDPADSISTFGGWLTNDMLIAPTTAKKDYSVSSLPCFTYMIGSNYLRDIVCTSCSSTPGL